jgi:hypothetical protein
VFEKTPDEWILQPAIGKIQTSNEDEHCNGLISQHNILGDPV